MKKGLAILLLLLGPANLTARQSRFEDPLLEHLAGQWVMEGTVRTQHTTHDVTFTWVLAHQYLQMHEISREKDSTGKAIYEALVYFGWDPALNQYACLWLDVTGGNGLDGKAIGHSPRGGNKLTLLFDGGDGSFFHTTFEYEAASDTWQCLMDNDEHGVRRPFARLTLQRKK